MTTKTICTTDTAPLDEYLGKNVIVRAVTFHYTGSLAAYDTDWLVLDDAAWVASSGRWSHALTNGILDEVEPYPGRCMVSRGAVVDLTGWDHPLPRATK